MKKNIFFLLAFVSVIFASCDPLKDSINDIKPVANTKTMALTLTSNYASVDAAKIGIANTLSSTYKHLEDGSKANVTYNLLPAQIKPVDSVLSSTAVVPTQYVVVDADYQQINGNSNKNFSAANLIKFLNAKFPAKQEKQLVVISYAFYSGGAANPAVPVTETYLYLNEAWIKAYHVGPAQYISAGKLNVFNFAAADEASLTGYFNTFLKSDASVSGKAKVGDVQYVSFTYFASGTIYQRIKALIFDGANWGNKPVATGPLPFLKKKGIWIPDPTVYYTILKAEYAVLATSEAGTPAGRANVAEHGSFDVSGSANNWTDSQINDAIIVILNGKYASAAADDAVFYNITYALYKGSTPTATKQFVKTSTGFVFVPSVD